MRLPERARKEVTNTLFPKRACYSPFSILGDQSLPSPAPEVTMGQRFQFVAQLARQAEGERCPVCVSDGRASLLLSWGIIGCPG